MRKTCAKLTGDFADIQVGDCLRPHDIRVILLVVSNHALAGMAGDLLPILSGFLIQVQRQRTHFVESPAFPLLSTP